MLAQAHGLPRPEPEGPLPGGAPPERQSRPAKTLRHGPGGRTESGRDRLVSRRHHGVPLRMSEGVQVTALDGADHYGAGVLRADPPVVRVLVLRDVHVSEPAPGEMR